MTNTRVREYADQLADILRDIDDRKEMIRALVEAAEKDGINTKALKKVAREMVMDAAKRAQKYADETELDQMRMQLSLFPADEHDRRAA